MNRAMIAVLVLILCLIVPVPIFTAELGAYHHGQPSEGNPRVALTFDDGPHIKLTPRLLDICSKYGVKVTFFVVGQRVSGCRDILKRMVNDGHEISNHTWNHPKLTSLSYDSIYWQIERTQDSIEKITGYRPTLCRPPYGATNSRINNYLAEKFDLRVVMWSVDPSDWRCPGSSVVASRVVSGAQDGSIILLHDIHRGTIEAVPTIIEKLKMRGFIFVTVSEIIS